MGSTMSMTVFEIWSITSQIHLRLSLYAIRIATSSKQMLFMHLRTCAIVRIQKKF